MPESGQVFLDLFILFAAARIGGAVVQRLGQPAVVGEILAGMVIGPHLLGLVTESEFQGIFAELGVVFLLFMVGLETQPSGLLRVGRQAAGVAVLGVVVPFGLAMLTMSLLKRPLVEGLFVGAALMATSVGITARVLGDLGYTGTRVARIIIGAAVIDDILGILVLAVVSGLAAGQLSFFEIEVLTAEAIAFVVTAVLVGRFAMGRISPRLSHSAGGTSRGPLFAVAIALCYALSALADTIGLAAIIGAFFAGIIFAEIPEARELRRSMEPIYAILVPIFFVLMGARVDTPRLLSMEVLPVGLLITAVAVIGKLVGCGLGAYGLGRREALAVGVGMTPRGEVGIVVALIGLSKGVITSDVYSQVILMSILTSLFAPSLLRVLLVPPAETNPDGQEASS
ncbi:MAG TPA: cation:proton antiporter [Planctomycetota bacterium]|nr:cation:proton antiporter [Planctomycetota bacterium]